MDPQHSKFIVAGQSAKMCPFHKPVETQGNCWKNPGTEAFQKWTRLCTYVRVSLYVWKASIMTWSSAKHSRQGFPKGGGWQTKQKTVIEMLTFSSMIERVFSHFGNRDC